MFSHMRETDLLEQNPKKDFFNIESKRKNNFINEGIKEKRRMKNTMNAEGMDNVWRIIGKLNSIRIKEIIKILNKIKGNIK